MALQTLVERCPVLLAAWQPTDFRDCKHTGKQLILNLVDVICSLGPHVALYTNCKILFAAECAQWIKAVDLVERVHTPTAVVWLVNRTVGILCLREVKIEMAVRYND